VEGRRRITETESSMISHSGIPIWDLGMGLKALTLKICFLKVPNRKVMVRDKMRHNGAWEYNIKVKEYLKICDSG
jgi:hypothetical protein